MHDFSWMRRRTLKLLGIVSMMSIGLSSHISSRSHALVPPIRGLWVLGCINFFRAKYKYSGHRISQR
jgi:hypothetical protein